MKIEINSTYTIKLNSGEELIARVTDVQDTFITLHEPLSVAPGPKGMGLVPSVFTAEAGAETRLNTSSIAMVVATAEDIKMKYIETTTGLSLPDKKILVG